VRLSIDNRFGHWQSKQARLLVTVFDLVFETLNIKAMHQLWEGRWAI
jgi:hypothetical protein